VVRILSGQPAQQRGRPQHVSHGCELYEEDLRAGGRIVVAAFTQAVEPARFFPEIMNTINAELHLLGPL